MAFADDAYGALLGGVLGRYRFTAREDQATWSEAAIDPEMLGRAFEGLMAHTDRKASGTFFTPQSIVQRVTSAALEESLRGHPASRDVMPGLTGEPLAAGNSWRNHAIVMIRGSGDGPSRMRSCREMRRRSMSLTPEDADPSEQRAVAQVRTQRSPAKRWKSPSQMAKRESVSPKHFPPAASDSFSRRQIRIPTTNGSS